jgi:formylglycine-generating enzyme required for sulfatase activity
MVETLHVAPSEIPRGVFEPETVRIPAGSFLMGSTDEDDCALDIEKPQNPVELSEYYIGKYPLTNAEYQIFLGETRHPPPQNWKGASSPPEKKDHPVVYVSLHDALAYCQWISEKSDKNYCLPTEAEWEKAARGVDGRIYPWGDDWDEKKVNSMEGGPGGTTPVGQYSPIGDSPYGLADMSGNVWEWTRNLWGKESEKLDSKYRYPYDPNDRRREDLKVGNGVMRVLRGGAFGDYRDGMRCAVRNWNLPVSRLNFIGFRVVLYPSTSEL